MVNGRRDWQHSSPHTRGGGPWWTPERASGAGFSPHAWGWTDRFPGLASRKVVLPTRVGVDRIIGGMARNADVLPTRVGVDRILMALSASAQSSPHTRGGGPAQYFATSPPAAVLPTRVGVDRHEHQQRPTFHRSPHTRGGGPLNAMLKVMMADVLPPRVGVDRTKQNRRRFLSSSPHTRGGGPFTVRYRLVSAQFSPHAWGWTARGAKPIYDPAVFPTRVGVDRSQRQSHSQSQRSPHTRGGGPYGLMKTFLISTFSPHAWGWTVPISTGGTPTPFSPHAWGWTARLQPEQL